MENNLRFRNHFSIVLPNLKKIIWMIVYAFAIAFLQEDLKEAMLTVITWIVLIIVIVGWQIIVWRKTWITIEDNSIVIERNTRVSRKKNTIGIANISNVNLEQSFFAMIIGTCKLKLDTNSLSTANDTDVTIVLKKKQAEEVRMLLTTRISGESVQNNDQTAENRNVEQGTRADMGELLLHGIFASRFLYVFLIPLFLIFEFVTEMTTKDFNSMVQDVNDFATGTIGITAFIISAVVSWMFLALGFNLIRTVIKYWEFQIERNDEKLILQYGLTKKVTYSIPVNKIQAVVVNSHF